MKIAILDKGTLGDDIILDPISKLGETSVFETTPPKLVADRIADADVVIVNKIKLNRDNLADAKNLKLICVAATGFDNIDLEFCKASGIALCNVPGYSTDSVMQLTLSMALSLATNLTQFRSYVHSGEYSVSNVANRLTPVYHELSGMTWGVVGGGGIGKRVADVAHAIGCRVVVCRKSKEPVYEQVTIDELCKISDIISLHVPLDDSTRGMISRERIESMKDGAILINVARGAVTDEKALANAVKSGKLGGLGVDVYSSEPFAPDHPFTELLGLQNVCLTPHMAWGSFESRMRCVHRMAENITAFFSGEHKNRIV